MIAKNTIQNSKKSHSDPKLTAQRHDHYDLLVFCHLRWDFVYQRPQHIISRLASQYRILFVEEPSPKAEPGHTLNILNSNLHIFKPNIQSMDELPEALLQLTRTTEVAMGWFYSPAFYSVLSSFSFDTVIYDCMDELSLFKGAPAELIDQERSLLEQADMVFTGGRSLFDSKNKVHGNVHCFPSSVDLDHFARSKNGISIPSDIADIPAPIVGYVGVIDERIDLDLIRQTAKQMPEVSFVMIGPVVKISEVDLPKLPNIYYLGMKGYPLLPNYLKAFKVAMMPFALNEATRYISPTKTLEYMAAGKPIISTRIKDVVREYADSVQLISDAAGFVEELNKLLTPALSTTDFTGSYYNILINTSWNSTVLKMDKLVNQLAQR